MLPYGWNVGTVATTTDVAARRVERADAALELLLALRVDDVGEVVDGGSQERRWRLCERERSPGQHEGDDDGGGTAHRAPAGRGRRRHERHPSTKRQMRSLAAT